MRKTPTLCPKAYWSGTSSKKKALIWEAGSFASASFLVLSGQVWHPESLYCDDISSNHSESGCAAAEFGGKITPAGKVLRHGRQNGKPESFAMAFSLFYLKIGIVYKMILHFPRESCILFSYRSVPKPLKRKSNYIRRLSL